MLGPLVALDLCIGPAVSLTRCNRWEVMVQLMGCHGWCSACSFVRPVLSCLQQGVRDGSFQCDLVLFAGCSNSRDRGEAEVGLALDILFSNRHISREMIFIMTKAGVVGGFLPRFWFMLPDRDRCA